MTMNSRGEQAQISEDERMEAWVAAHRPPAGVPARSQWEPGGFLRSAFSFLRMGMGVQKKNSCRGVFTLTLTRTEVRLLSAAVLPCVNYNFAHIGTPDERMELKAKLNLAMRRVLETIE